MDRYSAAAAGLGPISWIADIVVPPQNYLPATYDRHMRRDGDDYIDPLSQLLPQGQAWPKWDTGSLLMKFVAGCAQIFGDVDSRASDLLERESDPRLTIELLPDWERNFGLPDDCLAEPVSIGDRQQALTQRMTLQGDQSRQFFLDYASAIGQKIQVIEHSPFMCGVSQCGDTRGLTDSGQPRWEVGGPNMRFYWTIAPDHPRLTWFRTGQSACGEHLLTIGIFTDAECIWNRLKPAHTELAFDFGNLVPLTKFQGIND